SNILAGARTSKRSGIDLDLGCMFQMADGTPGCVQALGNSWGNFNGAPFVHLEGDDRSGANTEGENLFINGDQLSQIKRMLIFTFIYEGAPNWAVTNGAVTIEAPGQAPVEVRLDNGTDASMCAIAMIENNGGQLQITKVVEYFSPTRAASGHELMNNRFGFGLRFKAGTKD
ncbi:MAG: tellurium resistance protein, partial [Herminiimonas sp.]|nr:tellurium resistance protein [Herminiimonas sp.]